MIWVAELPKAFRMLLTPGTVFLLYHAASQPPTPTPATFLTLSPSPTTISHCVLSNQVHSSFGTDVIQFTASLSFLLVPRDPCIWNTSKGILSQTCLSIRFSEAAVRHTDAIIALPVSPWHSLASQPLCGGQTEVVKNSYSGSISQHMMVSSPCINTETS